MGRGHSARADENGFLMVAVLGLRCKRSLQVFPPLYLFCHFSQSSLLETVPEDQTPPRREGSWTSGRLTYKMSLCSTFQRALPPADINASIQRPLNDACCGLDPGLGIRAQMYPAQPLPSGNSQGRRASCTKKAR